MEQSSSCCSESSSCPCTKIANCLWKNPIKGIVVTIVANVIFFTFFKGANLFSVLANLFLVFIAIQVVRKMLFSKDQIEQSKEMREQKMEERHEKMKNVMEGVKKTIEEITSLQDCSKTIRFTLAVYGILKFLSLFPLFFIFWVLMNIALLYAPINKFCPNFIFRGFIAVKQILEGVFGVIECLIPKYVEEEQKEKKE